MDPPLRLLGEGTAFMARNISSTRAELDGQSSDLSQKTDVVEAARFTNLTVSAIK